MHVHHYQIEPLPKDGLFNGYCRECGFTRTWPIFDGNITPDMWKHIPKAQKRAITTELKEVVVDVNSW